MNELEKILPPQYNLVINKINEVLSKANQNMEQFNKASSQFKTTTLDIVDLTPINAAKHLLAVIQHTRHALEEASISLRKKQLQLKQSEVKLLNTEDEFEIDKIQIDMDELKLQIKNLEDSGKGAFRRLSYALDQYQSILKELGLEQITESDFEKDEVRYHIMTAFNQALTAARARGGLIDEGNHIYLFQLGINGAMAQAEVTSFMAAEQEELNNNRMPDHNAIIIWLNRLADKYLDNPAIYANTRKLNINNKELMIG